MKQGTFKTSILDKIAGECHLGEDQLLQIKSEIKQDNESIQKVFAKHNVHQELVAKALARALNIRYVDLSMIKIPPDALLVVPEEFCNKHALLPILKIGTKLVVAMLDPLDVKTIEQIEFLSQCQVEVVTSTESEIRNAIDKFYGVKSTIKTISESIQFEELTGAETDKNKQNAEIDQSGPVAKLVNLLITQALQQGASDVHLEPSEHQFQVRYRVDGMLQKAAVFEKSFANACVSSIKIMANMDITERRIPQDGRIHTVIEGRPIDLRVSTLPTLDGEKAVMRILDKTNILLELEQLGFSAYDLERLKKIIKKPNGIVLVSGPTGSGKTTTLYAVLQKIATINQNITTLEDPIEYRLDKINQSQINVKAGMNFAKGLRAILRQDPDVVMVGEIRDRETAEIAIQAALTGHLVFSTIHTNDAPSSITRLVEMGIEPFLVSSSLEGVLAQRLVRKLCPYCRKPYKPDAKVYDWFGIDTDENLKFYKPTGCRECKRTGYKGRMGLYELLVPNEEFKSKIVSGSSDAVLKAEAQKAGMHLLMEDGQEKVKMGLTSVEEVMRVAKGDLK
ncbi:MAG: type II/IV secretion system protein [Calditrichaeota bacterium]|nr:type II/IV secretion system protein [Calditrichota bacterium]